MAFSALSLADFSRKASISALDVVRFTDALTFEGPITEDEARTLFEIEFSPAEKHPSWKGFFIDAIAEYAIHHSEPHGYLTAHKADWLLRQVAPAGRVLTRNTFTLLTTLVAVARWVPERLTSALLDEVYCAVAAGDGPMREGVEATPGTIIERDCEIVRHILYSSGTSGHRSITRTEAEGLLAIHSGITGGAQSSGWTELFCKAMGDAALSATGRMGPAREVYLRAEADPRDAGALPAILRRCLGRYRPQAAEDRAIAALERQRISIITGDDVRCVTAEWLGLALAPHDGPTAPDFGFLLTALAEHDCMLEGAPAPSPVPDQAIRAA